MDGSMNADTVIVVFRTFKDSGRVIALFPFEPDTAGHCMSYMHVGQHSGASYTGCIQRTRPATPAEIAPLRAELEAIGYRLTVRSRAVRPRTGR